MKCKVYWRKQIKRREIDAHVNDAVKSHHYLQLGGVKRLLALILTQVSSAIEIQNGFNSNGKNYMALSVSEKIINTSTGNRHGRGKGEGRQDGVPLGK